MKSAVVVLALVACSDPPKHTDPPHRDPVVATVDAAAAPIVRHAAPNCPIPELTVDAPPPDSGGEGIARRDKPEHPKDRCETADSNLARVEQAILASPSTEKPVASKPWDKTHAPAAFGLVTGRLALQAEELAILNRNGFVALQRFTNNYGHLFHEVFQSQLPIYVSVDAVMHAIYLGNDGLIGDIEDSSLRPILWRAIDRLACQLPASSANYSADTQRDLDVYLTVARALMTGQPAASMFGDPTVEAEAQKLVDAATAGAEMAKVTLFGRERVIDFTAYTPRSHYVKTAERKQFFRAGMWMSRLEFNLVSRSSRSSQPGDVPNPAETPREAVLALAIADLAKTSGALDDFAKLDRAWALFAGRREDISLAKLDELRTSAGIAKLADPAADIAAKLRAAIGDKFARTARLHYMPQGSTNLPAIATVLGPRVVPDAQATKPIVSDEVPNREVLHAADIAYALGHDRALEFLADDRKQFPTLDAQLAKARTIMQTAPRGDADLYSSWLDAIVAIGGRDAGVQPSYTTTPAYADLRMSSALVGFGQLHHNFALVAGESYFAGGCEIPDGYVEPATKTYDKLLEYLARLEAALPVLDPTDGARGLAYVKDVRRVLQTLLAIQRDELAGKPLSADQKSFLSMVVEMAPGTTGGPPTYTGWWFDLFRNREKDGMGRADYIASFFTGGKIAYVGATDPMLGVFVVDTNGAPRLVVGPVAHGYEFQGPVQKRLTDKDARRLTVAERFAPWMTSYVGPAAAPEPELSISWSPGGAIELETKAPIKGVTIEVLDHHRKPMTKATKDIAAGKSTWKIAHDAKRAEGLHIIVGKWNAWEQVGIVESSVYASWGNAPSGYNDDDGDQDEE